MILVLYLSSSQKTIKYSLEQNEYIQVKQRFFMNESREFWSKNYNVLIANVSILNRDDVCTQIYVLFK